MTEQQACTLCGAGGHTAAQCHWNSPGALESIRLPKHGTTIALEEMLAGYLPDDREYLREVIEAYADIQARKAVMLYSGAGLAGRQSDACDWLENLEGDAWADACEEIAASVQKHTEQAEGAQGEPLPYWEPCNPACDPELNGFRDRKCSCAQARAALAQPSRAQTYSLQEVRIGTGWPAGARFSLAQPSPATELERPEVAGWRDRILKAHPGSDPRYWPDALLVQHMTAEIADLRAAQARPFVDLEHIGALISVFRNATRADAENGGREYFESARNAERELREAIERIVGALRAELKSAMQDKTSTLMLLSTMREERDAAQARLAELEKQEPIQLQHMAVAEDGELRWMTGRKIDNCELYAMPDFGRAPKLYAAPVTQADQLHALDKQCRDDVARALGLTPQGDGYAWSALLADIKTAAKVAQAGQVPDGWKLVPIEPTQAMFESARISAPGSHTEKLLMASYWRNMVAATPQPVRGDGSHE